MEFSLERRDSELRLTEVWSAVRSEVPKSTFSEKVTLQILISLIILKKNILNPNNLRNTLSKRRPVSISIFKILRNFLHGGNPCCVSQNFNFSPNGIIPSSRHEIWRMFLYFLTLFFHSHYFSFPFSIRSLDRNVFCIFINSGPRGTQNLSFLFLFLFFFLDSSVTS